jgi:hypothetical protein
MELIPGVAVDDEAELQEDLTEYMATDLIALENAS